MTSVEKKLHMLADDLVRLVRHSEYGALAGVLARRPRRARGARDLARGGG